MSHNTSKVLMSDGKYYQMTSRATVTVVNDVADATGMDGKDRTTAITVLLGIASKDGTLVLATMTNGEEFLGVDKLTGAPVRAAYSDISPPPNIIGFSKL